MKLATGLCLALCLSGVTGSYLWDYVHTPDPTYSFVDTGTKKISLIV